MIIMTRPAQLTTLIAEQSGNMPALQDREVPMRRFPGRLMSERIGVSPHEVTQCHGFVPDIGE